jgi:hypothetical protein
MQLPCLIYGAQNGYEPYKLFFVFLFTNKMTSGMLIIRLENYYELNET